MINENKIDNIELLLQHIPKNFNLNPVLLQAMQQYENKKTKEYERIIFKLLEKGANSTNIIPYYINYDAFNYKLLEALLITYNKNPNQAFFNLVTHYVNNPSISKKLEKNIAYLKNSFQLNQKNNISIYNDLLIIEKKVSNLIKIFKPEENY